jgi:hypothetical protein
VIRDAEQRGMNCGRRRETREQMEHRCDRQVAAAVWRRERAARGLGYQFKIPAKAAR